MRRRINKISVNPKTFGSLNEKSNVKKVNNVPQVRRASSVKKVVPTNTQQPPQPRKGSLTPALHSLQVTRDMFIANIQNTQHIIGDIVILGETKENLPTFYSKKKIIFAKTLEDITSSKISFIYIKLPSDKPKPTEKAIKLITPKMNWGSIIFIPFYNGYQGKIKTQRDHFIGNPSSQVWDEFIQDNFLQTYSSKQRPLIPHFMNNFEDYLAIKFLPNPKKLKHHKGNLSVATVWRSGGSYTQAHVKHIYESCKATIKEPFDFYCLTDSKDSFNDPGINKILLQHNWPGYWSKMELFKPNQFKQNSNVFYIDLDTLITGDVTDIATYDTDFMGMRDFNTLNFLSSGILKFKPEKVHYLYHTFYSAPSKWMKCRAGDQEAIFKILRNTPEWLQDLFPRRMAEFINHCWWKRPVAGNHWKVLIPDNYDIVCFHGRPKMEDIMHDAIIQKYWYK